MEPASLSGLDSPSTYRGFVDMFPGDASSAAYPARLRWPQGRDLRISLELADYPPFLIWQENGFKLVNRRGGKSDIG